MSNTLQIIRRWLIILLCCTIVAESLHAQKLLRDSLRVRKYIVVGSEAVLAGGSLIALNSAWYNEYPRSSFHFFNDNHEWLQMDKAGHFMSGYYLSSMSTSALRWSGMKRKRAVVTGGITGLAYLSGIEIIDGFSQGWGFSLGDEIANFTGSTLFISQELLWQQQRITIKFSYSSTSFAMCNPDLLGRNFQQRILKDYNGQTYWASCNISLFLAPDKDFPKWLNIAFGYGANGMTGSKMNVCSVNNFQPTREFYLSFDADLNRVAWPKKWMKTTAKILSFIKIPAPTLEVQNDGLVKVHALFF
ncbi:MAG: DUF2279 domain-containing protein [Crocinitomicaceae bacterium]|nr:DUF2279 domain-containing protein [Crocinitomicaceae bacterium]